MWKILSLSGLLFFFSGAAFPHLTCAQGVSPAPAQGNQGVSKTDARTNQKNEQPGVSKQAAPAAHASSSASTDKKSAEQATSRARANDAKAYYNLGVKHGRAGRFGEAAEAFKHAVELNPNYADAYFGLGHAYSDQGRWQEAVDAYEKVIRLNPKDDEAYARLGEAYARLRAQKNSEAEKANKGVTVTNIAAPTANASSAGATTGTVNLTNIYLVGPGDVLDIRLLNAPAGQKTLYTVADNGLLDYPLVGNPFNVVGLAPDEIKARIVAEIKRRAIYDDPQLSVGVSEYASHNIIVSGLVADPGTKVIRREAIPLYVVIADAQPRPEAARAVIISHATGQKYTVDLSAPEAMNTLVRPGDVINVEARPQQFIYVSGAVNDPGEKLYRANMTVTQAILAAGGVLSKSEEKGGIKEVSQSVVTLGVKPTSRAKKVMITRQGVDGRLATTSYSLKDIVSGKTLDPVVQPGDRIEVGS
jgi:protein involved in polysaccharide export with SLBB domain